MHKQRVQALSVSFRDAIVGDKRVVSACTEQASKKIEATSYDIEIKMFLRSRTSFSLYNKNRLNTEYASKEQTGNVVKERLAREKDGLVKPRDAVGPVQSYMDDQVKTQFLSDLESYNGNNINWSEWARKYGIETPNGGAVLKKCAMEAGVNVNAYNCLKTVSGRDIERRIRRHKKRIDGTNVV